jgi:segregation and condensation protein A
MEESREYALDIVKKEKVMSFEKIFDVCKDRIHAIFIFLSVLELIQMRYMSIMVGEGRNNFIVEFNENREEDIVVPLPGDEPAEPAASDSTESDDQTDAADESAELN